MKWFYTRSLPLILILVFSCSQSNAADVNITVNGSVVVPPCIVSTKVASVKLGDLYTSNLRSAGSASPWHSVALELSNCPVGTSRVTARFSGTVDETGYYRNLGTAKNIQIELQDNDGITLNTGEKKMVQVNNTTKSAIFPLKVRALTVNGGVTQGTIQAMISVTYSYA
ncbi:type 1 fimbrial protein (plasmid) [Serratia liquefaciens]|uniref:Type 1 fimbrial protein n=2 Tax=Serratia liquefaciens TaxID=614 RepID=A0A515D5W3_SERLI|nr:type 1 fimbrial protein [Serratia liquefaciens]